MCRHNCATTHFVKHVSNQLSPMFLNSKAAVESASNKIWLTEILKRLCKRPKIVAHKLGETPGHSFAKLAVTNQKYNHFNHESTTTTRLQEHNDKYIYKSVVSFLQYISKDILSLQWPLSNEKRQNFAILSY